MVRLSCAGVRFGSYLDEKHLFTWVEEIPCFDRWDGDTLVLRSGEISEVDLRNLLALFSRYRLPMQQLAQFETGTNKHWFKAPSTFWYLEVFGGDDLDSSQG
nr:hypothetical protein [Dyella sp. ASV24]